MMNSNEKVVAIYGADEPYTPSSPIKNNRVDQETLTLETSQETDGMSLEDKLVKIKNQYKRMAPYCFPIPILGHVITTHTYLNLHGEGGAKNFFLGLDLFFVPFTILWSIALAYRIKDWYAQKTQYGAEQQ